MKHTAGAWEFVKVEKFPFGVIVRVGDKAILQQPGYCHSTVQKTRKDCEDGRGFPHRSTSPHAATREQAAAYIAEQDANARLIAAAPDLLVSCKHMLDFCPPGLMSSLQAAIDKAEGAA